MICPTCTTLLHRVDDYLDELEPIRDNPSAWSERHKKVDKVSHHTSQASLQHAAEVLKCYICLKLVSEVPELIATGNSTKDFTYQVLFDEPVLWQMNGQDVIDLRITFGTFRYGVLPLVTLRSFPNSSIVLPDLYQNLLPASTGDPVVLAQAASWLNNCMTKHMRCRQHSSGGSTYPKRLLDLRPVEAPPGSFFKLIEGEQLNNVTGPYVTLSHRWGKPENYPPQLNQETHQNLLEGWPISKLSGTLRDAVSIAVSLGVRYFWVDSLCIYQSDDLDILLEAHQMATVYGNAILNISSLAARQDGIFSLRDPICVSPSSAVASSAEHGFRRTYLIGSGMTWTLSVFGAPLSKRAWILQEQILARRTLFFGKEQMLWCCLEGCWSETHPMEDQLWEQKRFFVSQHGMDSVRSATTYANSIPEGQDRPSGDALRNELSKQPDYQTSWRQVVQEYVPRELTNPNDKLLALAGIASSFSKVTGDELLAGHWRFDLPVSLLWSVSDRSGLSMTAKSNAVMFVASPVSRAPSWSWASRDGGVSFNGRLDDKKWRVVAQVPHIEVKSIEVSGGAFRITKAGALHLKAAHVPVAKYGKNDLQWAVLKQENGKLIPEAVKGVACFFDAPPEAIPRKLYNAAIIACKSGRAKTSEEDMQVDFHCLILEFLEVSPGGRHRCKRVGFCTFSESLLKLENKQSTCIPSEWTLHEYRYNKEDLIVYPRFDFANATYMETVEIV